MRFPKTQSFFVGVLVGVVGLWWFAIGGIAPPAPQDTTRVDVSIVRLKSEDQWLEKVHFQLIPLDGVISFHKYAILVMTPPSGGIPTSPSGQSAELDLTASTAYWTTAMTSGRAYSFPEGIQPIGIARGDFGPHGDQVAIKFIDGSSYQPSQHLQIGSSPY